MTPWERPDIAVAELEEPGPWRNPVPVLWLAIVMLLTGAVAALLTGAADAPEGGDARARIVAAAGSATAGDFAFSMVLEFEEVDNAALDDATTRMEGQYDAETGRLHALATGSPAFEMEIIVAGPVQYMRFGSSSVFADATGGKPWGRVDRAERPTTSPAPFIENPLERLAELGELHSPIVRVGEEPVRGVDAVHYRTTIDTSTRAGATASEDRQPTKLVQVDIWLDGEDRLRRFRQSSDVNGTRFTTTLEVFDVGEPVSIELPPEDQVGPFDPKDLFPARPPPPLPPPAS